MKWSTCLKILGIALVVVWGAPVWALEETNWFIIHNAVTANTATPSPVNVSKYASVGIEVTITGTATVSIQARASAAGTFHDFGCSAVDTKGTVTGVTDSQLLQCVTGGMAELRFPITDCTSCTVTVSVRVSTAKLGTTGGGVVAEVDTLQTVFNRGKEITNANSLANAFQVGGLCLFTDVTAGPWVRPCTASDIRTRILTNFTYGWFDVEGDTDMLVVDPDAATKLLMYQFGANYRPLKSVWIGAGNFYGDGTNCPERPTAVTINSGPKIPTFICADNDGSRLTVALRMPGDWDGGTIVLTHAYIQTAADTGALNGDVAAQCRGAGETVSSTWGAEVAIDDAAVTGSNTNDLTVSGAVTPAGTCAAGDMLYVYYELDAVGTTTAVATLHHLGFHLTYSSTSLSH